MRKMALLAFALVVLTATACAPTVPTATPTSAPRATWTPTIKPTGETTVPTSPAPSAAPTATSTAIPPTQAPSPTPTVKPGLFVTNLRIDPTPPTRGSELTFHATFLNTTGTVQNFKWLVFILKPDNLTKSFGETTAGFAAIPTGGTEFKSLGSWKLALGGPCENFVARVAWLDENNKIVNFTQPDGQVYDRQFTVCAPGDLPSPTPAPTATPTPTPTFAPGLFVIDLRTEPHPPTRGADLNFYVTFVNTIGSLQNAKWNVYLFKPGERNSFGETTTTTTTLGIGINEYKVTGSWKLPLGGPCENFVARVGWFDNENKLKLFVKFENEVFEKPLAICPP